eukprot:m.118686 g.118686  ORF g.118686 m.118686 type:complete len:336 (+) comp37656_c0_seq3:57-1064(+)
MPRPFSWKMSSSLGRMLMTNPLCALFTLLAFFCLGVTLLQGLPQDKGLEPHKSMTAKKANPSVAPRFTVILQTFNRTDLLLKLLHHYSAVHSVDRIIVVWNNVGQSPPADLWKSFEPHPVPVDFLSQSSNRMRNRLQDFPHIRTNAVLIVDDDMLVSAGDLSFAFTLWQAFPDQIVGYVPRKHILSPSGVYSYGSYELETKAGDGQRHDYSMVLIGASFVHRKYLRLFERAPPAVHRLVDETQNCDDIAFNVMVARQLARDSRNPRPAGLFVRPYDMRNLEADAESGYRGMWRASDHMLERSYCLNRLAEIYGDRLTLPYSNIEISQFRRCSSCK